MFDKKRHISEKNQLISILKVLLYSSTYYAYYSISEIFESPAASLQTSLTTAPEICHDAANNSCQLAGQPIHNLLQFSIGEKPPPLRSHSKINQRVLNLGCKGATDSSPLPSPARDNSSSELLPKKVKNGVGSMNSNNVFLRRFVETTNEDARRGISPPARHPTAASQSMIWR